MSTARANTLRPVRRVAAHVPSGPTWPTPSRPTCAGKSSKTTTDRAVGAKPPYAVAARRRQPCRPAGAREARPAEPTHTVALSLLCRPPRAVSDAVELDARVLERLVQVVVSRARSCHSLCDEAPPSLLDVDS